MLSDGAKAQLAEIMNRYPEKRSAILPALYLAQREYGQLTHEAMGEVASLLDLDPTEVNTVAGFYTLFYREEVGKFVIQVCEDLPCALSGGGKIIIHCKERLGILPGQTTRDGLFTLQTAMCIAACHHAPAMQINLKYYEDLTPQKVDEILEELRTKGGPEK